MYEISDVANGVVMMMGLMSCNIETAWKRYTHESVKEGYTLQDVKSFINKKIKQGKSIE